MKRECHLCAITMIMIAMISFAFAGQTPVVAQSDSKDVMFTSSEYGAPFSMDQSIDYVVVQPSFYEIEQTNVTEPVELQGHADIGTDGSITITAMSVSEGVPCMLVSGSHKYIMINKSENSDKLISDAMTSNRFQLPET